MTIAEPKKIVLLVDDAPANIRMATAMLKDAYEIRFATDGAMALDLAKTTPAPDLILLDVMMAGMDGYEVCTRLKADPETREIPVIFVTGQTEITDESKGFKVEAVDSIHKPFSEAIVLARVHTHLTLQGVRQQLAQQLRTFKHELETARRVQLSILRRDIFRWLRWPATSMTLSWWTRSGLGYWWRTYRDTACRPHSSPLCSRSLSALNFLTRRNLHRCSLV